MEISPYKVRHVMIMAFGKLITKEDQRKIGYHSTEIASGRRVVYLFGRTAEGERKRLEALKLSKEMLVFEITDAQFGLRGKEGFTWNHWAAAPHKAYEPNYFSMAKPTKKQWDAIYHIGLKK